MFPEALEFHVSGSINNLVEWMLHTFRGFFDWVAEAILGMLMFLNDALSILPWWAYLLIVCILAWLTTRRVATTVTLTLLPLIIGIFGLWELAINTLAIILAAAFISILVGIPLGVLIAESPIAAGFIRPLLDLMQTMPSFVYLIPAVIFFGLGYVPAVFATIIYSLPPIIRLTDLGLNQVSEDVIEAALSCGATRWQLLREVQLPLAVPSILAGINQTTMMALAMVVVAAMIGGGGLGYEVLRAINRIDVGSGFEAGISVVILAIIIDRLTQGLAKRWEPPAVNNS